MQRRILIEASGEQDFEVEAEMDEDQADEATNIITSSDFQDAVSNSVQEVAPDAIADAVSSDSLSTEEVPEACEDFEPPRWWRINSCAKQKSSNKCRRRVEEDSEYCRKTCGLCGDETLPPSTACYDMEPPLWWGNNSCAKQKANNKCAKRVKENSIYCRKTCGMC
jgi:hypothetical protein